jgi:hypothetical protein
MTGNTSVFWALAALSCGASAVAIRVAFYRNKEVAPFVDIGALIGCLVFGGLWLADSMHAAQPLTINALRCHIVGVAAVALAVGCSLPEPPVPPDDDDELEKD